MSILLASLCLVAQSDLRPKVAEARLFDQGRALAPVFPSRRETENRRLTEQHPVPGGTLVLGDASIELSRDGAPAWRLERPANDLRFAGADGGVAYFTEPFTEPFTGGAAPRTLARLDLVHGAWLARWMRFGEGFAPEVKGAAPGGSGGPLSACVAADGALFCLFLEELASPGPDAPAVKSYRVARIRTENGQALWSRSFRAQPPDGSRPGAMLLAPMQNGPWSPATRALSACGGDVLVCLGGREPLMRLKRDTGAELWRLEAPWEYERTYVGPSVWQHFLARCGDEALFFEEDPAVVAKARERFDASWAGGIAAGPFVVRPGGESTRILLVVARAPRGSFAGQLAAMSVLEISDDGRPRTLAPLPRPTSGAAALELPDRVVLPLTRGAFACAGTSGPEADGFGFPGGGSDRLGRILWYRDPAPPPRRAWISTDPAVDACALAPRLCARVVDGGYVIEEHGGEFRFPLEFLGPVDGASRFAELVVPFEGTLAKPDTNYAVTAAGMRAWGWRGLSISGLAIAGDEFGVVIANERASWTLTFRL